VSTRSSSSPVRLSANRALEATDLLDSRPARFHPLSCAESRCRRPVSLRELPEPFLDYRTAENELISDNL
jgi:hypothetical protein